MFNSISASKLADRAKTFFSRLDSLAKKTKLIVRRSAKFSADGFTLGILKAVITGNASFNQLVTSLKLIEPEAMSRQALHKRVDRSAVAFMMSATVLAIKERWDEQTPHIVSKRFNRVIIEDSLQAKTYKRNAEDFPAHGNGKGETAGCKIDLAFDLLTGEPISEALHLATEQDREIGKEIVDLIMPDDLVLRDMGYFSTGEFARIELLNAFWLSRLPVSVKAHDLEERKLETILRATKAREIDCEICIADTRHPARLIAVRATPEVARERRRERREQARKLGKQPNKDMLIRDG